MGAEGINSMALFAFLGKFLVFIDDFHQIA